MLEKSSIDVLFITTPDFAHAKPAIEALKRGIHVYCEKPMAATLSDCNIIIDEAKKSKAVFYLGFNLRHSPVYDTIHGIIEAERLGMISTIEANEYYYGGKTFFRRWNRFRKFSGGLWVTKATHDFDLLNYMAGSKPKQVYAVGDLSYYRPKPEASTCCRDCKISDSCPDYYNVFNLIDPDQKFINRLRLIGEEHGQDPGDLCLFNSSKDTFDNGIKACYTLNVAGARSTRQMRIIGDKATLEADTEKGLVLITERHKLKEVRIDINEMMKGSRAGKEMLLESKNLCDLLRFECCAKIIRS